MLVPKKLQIVNTLGNNPVVKAAAPIPLKEVTFGERSAAQETKENSKQFTAGLEAAKRVIDVVLKELADDSFFAAVPKDMVGKTPQEIAAYKLCAHTLLNSLTIKLYVLYADKIKQD